VTPQLVVLAGPNGAGKSTFYEAFLAGSPLPRLDPDELAGELGVDPAEAARILDATRERMIEDKLGFLTETVFSDPVGAKLQMLRDAIAAGFAVRLVFVGIASVAQSNHRIDQRIAEGGHDVPRDRLPRRFAQSLANLRQAISFVPAVDIYDNSSDREPFQRVAVFRGGAPVWRARSLPAWARDVVRQIGER
jgi:predicted ABC-type ATPase